MSVGLWIGGWLHPGNPSVDAVSGSLAHFIADMGVDIQFILIPVLCVAIAAGAIVSRARKDPVEGNFFRKMYGSVGLANKDDFVIAMVLFSFNTDISFLGGKGNFAFDNPNVEIADLSYKVQIVNDDLTVYDVLVKIEMEKDGQYDVTSLVCNGEEKNIFPIGEIHFLYQDHASDFLLHGCNA